MADEEDEIDFGLPDPSPLPSTPSSFDALDEDLAPLQRWTGPLK